MPRVSEMIPSKFLKQDDVGTKGALLTIDKVCQYNVAAQGAGEELKWCLEFKEVDKPFVLNATNTRMIEAILGTDEADDWVGSQIVVYNDPTIMFGGKLTGGLRVRASARPQPKAPPTDEVPF